MSQPQQAEQAKEEGECDDVYITAMNISSTSELNKKLAAFESAEDTRLTDILHYKNMLRELVEEVTEDYKTQVLSAAEEGKRHVEIYSFPGDAKFKDTDHSLLFLTKGPRRLGQDFFLRLGLLPFLSQVWQIVRPFEAELRYDPESNDNSIVLRW